MKNKDKYDLRDLSIDAYSELGNGLILNVYDGDKSIFQTIDPKIYVAIEEFLEWLEDY